MVNPYVDGYSKNPESPENIPKNAKKTTTNCKTKI